MVKILGFYLDAPTIEENDKFIRGMGGEIKSFSKEEFVDFPQTAKDYDYIVDLSRIKLLKDFSSHLTTDPLVGFYFADFYQNNLLPIYHINFPSHCTKFPIVIYPTQKLLEALVVKANPLEYLSKKYISKHIPELVCIEL